MVNSGFLSFMHSLKVMNSPGLGQPSVFSMLESIRSPTSRNRELPPEGGQQGYGMEVADDGSSLMLCSPLIPQRDSLVEIAETEYFSFGEAGQGAVESYQSPLYQAHTIDGIDEEDDDEGEMRRTLPLLMEMKGEGFHRRLRGILPRTVPMSIGFQLKFIRDDRGSRHRTLSRPSRGNRVTQDVGTEHPPPGFVHGRPDPA